MNDIDFFRLLYSEYKEDLKAVLKYKKNGTNFYHFFTDKINIDFFEQNKKNGRGTIPFSSYKSFLDFYTEIEQIIVDIEIIRYQGTFFDKIERVLFHRDISITEYNEEGIRERLYIEYQNDNYSSILIGKEILYKNEKIAKTINHEFPFSFIQLADLFWIKYQVDIRRDFRYRETNKRCGVNLSKYYEDNHPFWIVEYHYWSDDITIENTVIKKIIVKVDGITGEEIFHREMLPEDMSYFPPTNIETTAP